MDDNDQRSSHLRRMVNGYQISQALHVAAVLGLADLLAAGPRTGDDLADATGCHPPTLYRLLRALAGIGILHEADDRRFALTDLGSGLRSDAPKAINGWAAFIGQPYYWQAWGDLLHSVRTGENAFRHLHGTDPWSYRTLHPELSAGFDRAMTSLSRQVAAAVLAAYDFGANAAIADIGGGNGAFLAAILLKHPATRGVLFDQAHVVSGAGPLLREVGVADRCVEILRACRSAMPDGATLLIVERELGGPNAAPDAKLSDLNMLVGPGGRERTHDEYARLLDAADLRLTGVTPSASGVAVFQGAAK
ncbi:MAG: methyltransferase [Thermomicrobiales bacterium]